MQPQGMARQACFSLPCLPAGHRRLQRRQQSPIYKRPACQWGLYPCTVLTPPSRHCFTHDSECTTAPITCPKGSEQGTKHCSSHRGVLPVPGQQVASPVCIGAATHHRNAQRGSTQPRAWQWWQFPDRPRAHPAQLVGPTSPQWVFQATADGCQRAISLSKVKDMEQCCSGALWGAGIQSLFQGGGLDAKVGQEEGNPLYMRSTEPHAHLHRVLFPSCPSTDCAEPSIT